MKKLLLVVTLILAGCASTTHYTTWEGHSEAELMLAWGANQPRTLTTGESFYTWRQWGCELTAMVKDGAIVNIVTNGSYDCHKALTAHYYPGPE